MNDLPREYAQIDERGRLTIRKKFIDALGLTTDDLKMRSPLLIEAHPSLEDCKFLSIKRR